MKLKIPSTVFICLCGSLLLAAEIDAEVVGKWRVEKSIVNGVEKIWDDTILEYDFKSNGDVVTTGRDKGEPEESMTLKFTASNGDIGLVFPGKDLRSGKYKFDGDRLILDAGDGESLVLVKEIPKELAK